jgi:FkbM family methyltransferase
MIKIALLKIVRFFYRLLSKIIYLVIPIISKILIILKLNSRIINQLNKLRSESHRTQNHTSFVKNLLQKNKLIALDVGAQGGFLNGSIFAEKYNSFFSPIAVEPIESEAKKLKDKNYQVIPKGLWSSNCKKKLYFLGRRSGSTSMYKPNKNVFDLFGFKKKNFHLFEVSEEIEVECTTLEESLNKLNIKNLDFLKIDTQGSELEIVKGIGRYLPLIIKIEVQIIPMYENLPNWGELINQLYKLNYMTCEWIEIGNHVTRSSAEMDMIFIPNYLSETGRKIILSREKEFTSLMLIFGQIKLLQNISERLKFSSNLEIQKLNDIFFC